MNMIAAVNPARLQLAIPKNKKPTWLIDVYAINLLMRTCFNAPNAPINIDPKATNINIGWKINKKLNITLKTNRKKNNTTVAFITMAKKAVIGVHIPSYTSATQMWQGNAPILKKKPNKIQTKANFISSTFSIVLSDVKYIWISKKSKLPTILNKILIPNNKIPVDIAPNEKYFIAASTATVPSYNSAAKVYKVKLNPSIAKYIPKKS